LRPNGAFEEAKRERNVITCKHLSADARLRLTLRLVSTKITEEFAMKSLAYATLFALALTPSCGFAQERSGHKMSDEELIKLSLSAAPRSIAKDATIVAMDHDGKMRNRAVDVHARSCRSGQPRPDVRRSKRDGMGYGLDESQGAARE
jgi:hypothetical protein